MWSSENDPANGFQRFVSASPQEPAGPSSQPSAAPSSRDPVSSGSAAQSAPFQDVLSSHSVISSSGACPETRSQPHAAPSSDPSAPNRSDDASTPEHELNSRAIPEPGMHGLVGFLAGKRAEEMSGMRGSAIIRASLAQLDQVFGESSQDPPYLTLPVEARAGHEGLRMLTAHRFLAAGPLSSPHAQI